jgi:tetratricopeptide (TPR) repeat protein
MFRREAYERAGGYRNEFYFAQDLDLWVRLVRLGSLVYAPEVLYEATYDYESITARHRDKQRALRSLIRRIHDVDKVGGDSSALLAQAARVRPDNVRRTGDRARAAYFIGSCLAARRDNRALAYLQEALRIRPFFVRGWLRLIRAHWQLR